MATRIKNGTSKKIWKIRLFLLIISFLLIIITLGFSIGGLVLMDTTKPPSTLYISFRSYDFVDRRHIVYEEDFEARWTVREFRFQSDGRFLIDLQLDYLSEDPKTSKIYYSYPTKYTTIEGDFEYVCSTVLLQISSVYIHPYTLHTLITDDLKVFIPITATSVNSKLCFAEYEREFDLPREKRGSSTLYGITVDFSWIRVFRDKNDEQFYYQWIPGWSSVSAKNDERLEADKTYSNISGDFGVYYPIPENVTSPLLMPSDRFDYVEWIRENM